MRNRQVPDVARALFGKQSRLLKAADFQWVFRRAKRLSSPYLTLLYRSQSRGCPRLGLVIAKKSLKHAVDRNRFKRICREQFRHHQHQLPTIDVIIISRKALKTFDNATLHQQLVALFAQLSVPS